MSVLTSVIEFAVEHYIITAVVLALVAIMIRGLLTGRECYDSCEV